MQSKSLLIAIAAFAVTATGVQAYTNTDVLERAEISEEQRSALEEAHELRKSGDFTAARDTLVDAGIDETVLHSLRKAAQESRSEMHDAVEAGDYNAFLLAIKGTPLEDVINSRVDFELFKEAHDLKLTGDKEGAKTLFSELGIEPHRHGAFKQHHGHNLGQLDDLQREALRVARQANDKEAVRAIFEEAGI